MYYLIKYINFIRLNFLFIASVSFEQVDWKRNFDSYVVCCSLELARRLLWCRTRRPFLLTLAGWAGRSAWLDWLCGTLNPRRKSRRARSWRIGNAPAPTASQKTVGYCFLEKQINNVMSYVVWTSCFSVSPNYAGDFIWFTRLTIIHWQGNIGLRVGVKSSLNFQETWTRSKWQLEACKMGSSKCQNSSLLIKSVAREGRHFLKVWEWFHTHPESNEFYCISLYLIVFEFVLSYFKFILSWLKFYLISFFDIFFLF